jgi:glycosyltransferase involved in cell wall biosynthesis
MNILLVSSSSGSRGGGELYLLYLGQALAARGHGVSLWASDHAMLDELAAQFSRIGPVIRAPYTNTYLRRGRSLSTCFNQAESRRIATSWRGFDLIHLNKQNLEDGLDLLRALDEQPLPAICTIHLTQSAKTLRARSAWIRDVIARRALKKCRRPLVAIAERRSTELARFLRRREGVHCIPNGVPLLGFPLRTTNPERPRIVAVGRLMVQKRPLLFLELAQRIHAQIPGARFTWVGDGWLSDDFDQRIAELKLTGIVERTGWQENVQPWLENADVFLHTAEYEGLPLAILEAMSARLPCLLTPSLLEELTFLKAGENCLVTSETNDWIAQLRNAILLQQIAAAGRSLIETQFSPDRMAAAYEALYLTQLAAR